MTVAQTVRTSESHLTLSKTLKNPSTDRRMRFNWSGRPIFHAGTVFTLTTESYTEFGKPVTKYWLERKYMNASKALKPHKIGEQHPAFYKILPILKD